MTTTRSTAIGCAAAAFFVAASLTGCDAGADNAPDTVESDPETSVESPPGDEQPGDGEGSTDPSCLVGDWVATTDALAVWYGSFLAFEEDVSVRGIGGEGLLSFSEDEYIFSTQTVSLGLTIDGQELTAVLTGGVAGSYWAESSIMSTTIEQSDFDVRVAVAEGLELSAREMGIDMVGAGAFAGYECNAEGLELETAAAGGGHVVYLQLIPAG